MQSVSRTNISKAERMRRRPQLYRINFRAPFGQELRVFVGPEDLHAWLKRHIAFGHEILAIRRVKDWRAA